MLLLRLPLGRVMASADAFVTATVLAVAVGSAAFVVTSAKISLPIRLRVVKRATKTKSPRWQWLADLLSCPFCVSWWLSFGAVAVYRPWLVSANLPEQLAPEWFSRVFDFVATSAAMTVVAMIAVFIIKKALLMDQPAAPSTPPAKRPAPASAMPHRPSTNGPTGVKGQTSTKRQTA